MTWTTGLCSASGRLNEAVELERLAFGLTLPVVKLRAVGVLFLPFSGSMTADALPNQPHIAQGHGLSVKDRWPRQPHQHAKHALEECVLRLHQAVMVHFKATRPCTLRKRICKNVSQVHAHAFPHSGLFRANRLAQPNFAPDCFIHALECLKLSSG